MKLNNQINQSIQHIAQKLGDNASHMDLSSRVRSEIIRAAIAIARTQHPQQENQIHNIYEIEKTFMRCSRLISVLWDARKRGEITESSFRNLEIQVNEQLKRLLKASESIRLS
ncbi:MAG: hypothetical protein ACPG0L_07930 [Bacteroidia bacterium]